MRESLKQLEEEEDADDEDDKRAEEMQVEEDKEFPTQRRYNGIQNYTRRYCKSFGNTIR